MNQTRVAFPSDTHREPLAGLDLTRFAAALLVMLYHLTAVSASAGDAESTRIIKHGASYPEIFAFSGCGFVGVEIFFVISGCVIAYSAESQSAKRFLRSRLARLYPTAWICATISVLVAAAFHLHGLKYLARGWLNSVILFPLPPWADGVYWTLGIEMVFYASVFALLSRNAWRLLGNLGAGLGAASAAYWIGGTILFSHFLQAHLWDRGLELSLIPYGCYFGLGIALYRLRATGPSLRGVLYSAVLVFAAGLEILQKTAYNNTLLVSPIRPAAPFLIFALALFVMVISLGWRATPRVAAGLRAIGLATYPLYLLHDIAGAALLRVELTLGLGRWWALAGAICGITALSLFVIWVAEPPLRRLMLAFYDAAGKNIARRTVLRPEWIR